MDGNWYSYYNIYLKFTALNVPDGYELYKVRAWRKVDGSILGEEIGTRADRIPVDEQGNPITDWYMYEDINFGDPMDQNQNPNQMSKGTMASALVGDRSTQIEKPYNPDGTGGGTVFETDTTANNNGNEDHEIVEENVRNEVRATFGALRLETNNPNDYPGTLQQLKAKFKVRAYFTKNTNPLANSASSNGSSQAPRRGGEKASPYDFDYYIAESNEIEFTQNSGSVITGIMGVKQDVNRQVVGVTYVNALGQMSSTPWQGVNIVVTRYSDGSTTTQKVIR